MRCHLFKSKAKIEENKTYSLALGDNTITLTVMAEDNIKKTYTIKIRRKDGNANLSNLTISDLDFEFNKDTLDYNLQIARDINSITIEATLESDLATISGLGEYYLNEEETLIKVVATAEDETQKTYTLNIKKEPLVEEKNQKKLLWIIVVSVLVVCFVIGSIVIFLVKKKKKQLRNKKGLISLKFCLFRKKSVMIRIGVEFK